VELSFAQDRWRAKVRFFAGLDERDVYVNPKSSFSAGSRIRLLEMHWFDGDDGTLVASRRPLRRVAWLAAEF